VPSREEADRIARTQSLFREVNERIAETAGRFDSDEAEFVCECADATCTDRIDVSIERYESVRSDGATFLLTSGHEDERVEQIVTAEENVTIVEKRHPFVAPLVRALNPRTA
jgi:hypothetical protein